MLAGGRGRSRGFAGARREGGFSLVEVAIVLVIIGLLLGGILKGQEMINSARARHLADLTTDIPAAYFGFIDRYRNVPGDWNAAKASTAIGVPVNGGGNDNGRIDNPPGGDTFKEPNALWEHLAAAGFLEGAYTGDNVIPSADGQTTPLNAFNNVVLMGRTADYQDATTPQLRLNLVLGRGIPVDIAHEVDIKLDDGQPESGVVRLAVGDPGNVFGLLGSTDPQCKDASDNYHVAGDSQDCNIVFLY